MWLVRYSPRRILSTMTTAATPPMTFTPRTSLRRRPLIAALPASSCRLLAALCLTFQQHEVVHQLLHAGAGLRRELLGRRIVHRRCGAVELVGSPRQRPRFAQYRRDRLRRRRFRPVHIVAHAADCAVHHKPPTADQAASPECRKRTVVGPPGCWSSSSCPGSAVGP